jgi:hypothetical protein
MSTKKGLLWTVNHAGNECRTNYGFQYWSKLIWQKNILDMNAFPV